MPDGFVLTLRLSLMGRPLKSYVFGKPVISIGRDPEADIFIDNPGVSREHLRFELNQDGEYEVVDCGSANGTLLNDLPVKVKIPVRSGDAVRVGKYTLAITYDLDRRDEHHSANDKAAGSDNHTLVLSRDELDRVREKQLKAESKPPAMPAAVAKAYGVAGKDVGVKVRVTAGAVGFLLGAAVGAAIVWFVVR